MLGWAGLLCWQQALQMSGRIVPVMESHPFLFGVIVHVSVSGSGQSHGLVVICCAGGWQVHAGPVLAMHHLGRFRPAGRPPSATQVEKLLDEVEAVSAAASELDSRVRLYERVSSEVLLFQTAPPFHCSLSLWRFLQFV